MKLRRQKLSQDHQRTLKVLQPRFLAISSRLVFSFEKVWLQIKQNLRMNINIERMSVTQNRRERISERLKILQELVPNGSKVRHWSYWCDISNCNLFIVKAGNDLCPCLAQVDLVTMLEKAISYVKFLQLQVKVWFQLLIIDLLIFIYQSSAWINHRELISGAI